jgi:hypothetical protein
MMREASDVTALPIGRGTPIDNQSRAQETRKLNTFAGVQSVFLEITEDGGVERARSFLLGLNSDPEDVGLCSQAILSVAGSRVDQSRVLAKCVVDFCESADECDEVIGSALLCNLDAGVDSARPASALAAFRNEWLAARGFAIDEPEPDALANAAVGDDVATVTLLLAGRDANLIVINSASIPDRVIRRPASCTILDVAVGGNAVGVARMLIEGGARSSCETVKMAISTGNPELIGMVKERFGRSAPPLVPLMMTAVDFHRVAMLGSLLASADQWEKEVLLSFALCFHQADAVIEVLKGGHRPWWSSTRKTAGEWAVTSELSFGCPPWGFSADGGWWTSTSGRTSSLDMCRGWSRVLLEAPAEVKSFVLPSGVAYPGFEDPYEIFEALQWFWQPPRRHPPRFATRTALHEAAGRGDIAGIRILAAGGELVNARGPNGETPIWVAALNGELVAVLELDILGADVNAPSDGNVTPIYAAAERGDGKVVNLLIALGADVNARGPDETSPLCAARRNGHAAVVAALLEAGATPAPSRWIRWRHTPGGGGFYLGMTGDGHDPEYPATVVAFTDWFVRNGWKRDTTLVVTDLSRIRKNFQCLPEFQRGGDTPRSRNLLNDVDFAADKPDDLMVSDALREVASATGIVDFNVGVLHWCNHGSLVGVCRAGRLIATSVPEMMGASAVVQSSSFLTIDLIDDCFAWLNAGRFFNATVAGSGPKNVILITAGTPPGEGDKITTEAVDLSVAWSVIQPEYRTWPIGGVDGTWEGSALGHVFLVRAGEYMSQPFVNCLEALTRTWYGRTHVHVWATREALLRAGQLLTKDVLCIDGSFVLAYKIPTPAPLCVRWTSSAGVDVVERDTASWSEGLTDLQVWRLILELGEVYGVQQVVSDDLSPREIFAQELPEFPLVRELIAAIGLTGIQARCAGYFVPIVRGAVERGVDRDSILGTAREIADRLKSPGVGLASQ